MKRRIRLVVGTLGVIGVVLVCGCRGTTAYVVPVADRTPATCGNTKLFGTDNVSFEYEELGAVGILSYSHSVDECVRAIVSEAEKLGADAILNFRMQPLDHSEGFWLVVGHRGPVELSGVAVKIKRP